MKVALEDLFEIPLVPFPNKCSQEYDVLESELNLQYKGFPVVPITQCTTKTKSVYALEILLNEIVA